MRNKLLKQLISRSRGTAEAEKYFAYKLQDVQPLADSAREMMSTVPPSLGACALLSASWAGFLQDQYSIPAIVVAGDLKIKKSRVFRCKKNIPEATNSGKVVSGNWDGHCWIEIDGFIGDLSIFRTAYAINGPSILKEYILSNFGTGRGAMLCSHGELPEGMQYIPKFVLKDNQINGLIAGLGHQLEHGI